ncbi:ABC transporter permease [Candidatus Similichlamydia epinepheli]|uniref:ABC transporter permease n=1 Tax=Candidatus Similichlamydia epinepheli TaxID=1903953 RepID=UPI000D34D31A|nr:ABC transporter permease [Candidatus Similichlamydia epinepheli]
MWRLIFKKAISAIMTLFSIATITFFLMKAIPGDPFAEERPIPKEVRKSLNAYYGLDRPIWIQYLTYMKGICLFDLGPSLKYPDRSVNSILREGFPVSAFLGVEALCLSLFLGLYLGAISAQNWRRPIDRVITVGSIVGISNPNFVKATLLQYIFAIKLGILPVACWGTFRHTVLPVIAIATSPSCHLTRLIRAGMINALSRDYIQTARAKGIPWDNVLYRHLLPEAILPALGVLGPLTSGILVGGFVVEKIFAIPGLGQWFIKSTSNRDYPLIMGLTIFYGSLLLIANFLVDLIHIYLDPRVASSSVSKRSKIKG